jgi:Uma2 family endonuclease
MATVNPTAVDEEPLYEVVNGERVEVPPMGAWAGSVASVLLHFLNAWAIPHRHGVATTEVLFRFRPNAPQRRPDLSFVSFDRWPYSSLPTEDPPAFDVVPNLAVEVVSPTNTAAEVEGKVEEYLQAGVELVWVVFPVPQRIHVYDSPTQARILRANDELDGGQVLPGFRLKIADLFAALVKPT